MSDYKIRLIALITFMLTVLQPAVNLPVLFQVSQVLAQTPAARKAEADRLLRQGSEQGNNSQFTAALQSFQEALIIYRQIKNRLGEARALGLQGEAYLKLGDKANAIASFKQALAIAKEINNQDLEKIAQERLQFAQTENDPRKAEADRLFQQGIEQFQISQFAAALQSWQQALIIYREIKDRLGEGNALGNLGIAYHALGEYSKAIEYHTYGLAIFREIKNPQGEGATLTGLGNAYRNLGEYSKAIEYYTSSLAIAREIKDREREGDALTGLGNAHFSLGEYSKAIEYYTSSLAIAREIKDRLGEGQSLGNLGSAYHALGDYTKAIEYHTSSLAIFPEIKDIEGEGTSLNNLGLTFYKSGNLPQAETTLFTTIEVWESIRGKLGNNDSYKVSIFEEQARTYRILQKVLIAQNKTNEALEISERGRARAFVELLTSRLSNTNTSQTSQPTVDKPTISLLQKIAKQQNATLVQYSIIPDDLKIDGKEQTKESELYIWVIKPTGEITFRKSDLKPLWQKENTTLAKLVDNSRESIGVKRRGGIVASLDPNAAPVKGRFQRLHELLITPIADLLPKKDTERVVFIPQSQLFLVPFPALQDEKGKYLIEKHTILTAPSIQVLDLTHKHKLRQTTKSQSSLIVGNPTMPKVILEPGKPAQQLTPLIWAEKEAKNIASMLNISALTGNKATKAAILEKMPQAGIIHFATHGLLDDNRGIGSAIAFAPSGKDDGLLTADEILNLKLNADLVVLSACDTGRGRITGDGVVGLSRSLISAGTASVIVSLWAVDDDSTSFLMTEFYKNREQKLDKATALRKAMLTTKAKYSSPYNWAAFTLIGESE
jgi:CHAT domain-containing protein/Flp pilus assembly protein TadD